MRWMSRWIFVRNAVKCGEFFFHRINRFHRISYIILPQKLMRWIFVRNAVNFAVNFCKKFGEMRWNICFYRIHCNHRISYKISPHSPHFLQKITLKPRPGYKVKLPKSRNRKIIFCAKLYLRFQLIVFEISFVFEISKRCLGFLVFEISTSRITERVSFQSKSPCNSMARASGCK